MIVICTVMILLNQGSYRDTIRASGFLIKDDNVHWTVDFTETFVKMKLDSNWNNYVQRIDGNACSYP